MCAVVSVRSQCAQSLVCAVVSVRSHCAHFVCTELLIDIIASENEKKTNAWCYFLGYFPLHLRCIWKMLIHMGLICYDCKLFLLEFFACFIKFKLWWMCGALTVDFQIWCFNAWWSNLRLKIWCSLWNGGAIFQSNTRIYIQCYISEQSVEQVWRRLKAPLKAGIKRHQAAGIWQCAAPGSCRGKPLTDDWIRDYLAFSSTTFSASNLQ